MTFEKPIDTKSKRETDDNYRGEIFRSGDWRIAVCKDHLQWLVQRRTRANSAAGPRWVSQAYCATQKGLVLSWPSTERAGILFIETLPRHVKFMPDPWT